MSLARRRVVHWAVTVLLFLALWVGMPLLVGLGEH